MQFYSIRAAYSPNRLADYEWEGGLNGNDLPAKLDPRRYPVSAKVRIGPAEQRRRRAYSCGNSGRRFRYVRAVDGTIDLIAGADDSGPVQGVVAAEDLDIRRDLI